MPERVTTLERLLELAEEKRAVIGGGFGTESRPRPAAFVINMAGAQILRMFKTGLYVYEKKEAQDGNNRTGNSNQ